MSHRTFDDIWPQHKTYSRKSMKLQRTTQHDVLFRKAGSNTFTNSTVFSDSPSVCDEIDEVENKADVDERSQKLHTVAPCQSKTTIARNVLSTKRKRGSGKAISALSERNVNVPEHQNPLKQYSLFSDIPEAARGRKSKQKVLSHALGKVPSMRPIKSPRFGTRRYINMVSSQLDTITSSQENTDGEHEQDGGTQTSMDTFGGQDMGDSQLSTLETLDLETGTSGQATTSLVTTAVSDQDDTTSQRAAGVTGQTSNEYTYTFTYVTGTNTEQSCGAGDTSIETPRRHVEKEQEPVFVASPIEMVQEDAGKMKTKEVYSPELEYATYWTQPANRFRLSSTLMDDSAELNIHRPLPAPDMSAITEMHDITDIQKHLETTPSAKASNVCPRLSRKRDNPPYNLEVTPQLERSFVPQRAAQGHVTNFEDSALGSESLCTTVKSKAAKTIDFTLLHDDNRVNQKAAQIKMTSTPQLATKQLMSDFSVELSEIARGDPDVELDIEESREVNSQEIVADSPDDDEEPLQLHLKSADHQHLKSYPLRYKPTYERLVQGTVTDSVQSGPSKVTLKGSERQPFKTYPLRDKQQKEVTSNKGGKTGHISSHIETTHLKTIGHKSPQVAICRIGDLNEFQSSEQKENQLETNRACGNSSNLSECLNAASKKKMSPIIDNEKYSFMEQISLIQTSSIRNKNHSAVLKSQPSPFKKLSEKPKSKVIGRGQHDILSKGMSPSTTRKSKSYSITPKPKRASVTRKSKIVCVTANSKRDSITPKTNNATETRKSKITPLATKTIRASVTPNRKTVSGTPRSKEAHKSKRVSVIPKPKSRSKKTTPREINAKSKQKKSGAEKKQKHQNTPKLMLTQKKQREYNRKTGNKGAESRSLKLIKANTIRIGNRKFKSTYPNFENIEDDFLANDDMPIPLDDIPKTQRLVKYVRPLQHDMLLKAHLYPNDFLECSYEESEDSDVFL